MKRFHIAAFLLLSIVFLCVWRLESGRRAPVKTFPDGAIPRHVFPAGARAVFDNSRDVTIYVVSETSAKKQQFHDYSILEQAKLNATQIIKLRTIFNDNLKRKGMSAACFWPQHGVRFRYKNQTLDFLICFHCGYIYTYFKGRETQETFSSQGLNEFNALWKSAALSPEKLSFPP